MIDAPAAAEPARGPTRERGWGTRLPLVVCGLVLVAAAGRIAVHDPTDLPVSGDQASFTYQALSLLGGDLAYDASDQARWLDLGWDDQPHGLFVQRRDDGWAFAKPLGYSVLLAPALAAAGAQGISLVGAALVLAYAGCWYGLGRLRWDRTGAAVVATAATVASHAWLFGFPAHADLFVAVLVGLAALGAARVALRPALASPAWLAVAAVASGVLVTEKLPALVALAPLLVVAFARAPGRARLLAVVAGAAVVAVSVVPYLYYSDGASWSAYGGDRYYAIGTTPWSGGTDADLTPWQTRDSLSPSFILDRATHPSDDLPSATLTYAIGRHTGVATFEPVVAALAVATALTVWRRRRLSGRLAPSDGPGADGPGALAGGGAHGPDADRAGVDGPGADAVSTNVPGTDWAFDRPDAHQAGTNVSDADRAAADRPDAHQAGTNVPGTDGAVALAAAAGLAAYVALYLVVFTDNYFGGGQSIGNRYFLQVSLLVPVVAVAAGVSSWAARWCGAVAACSAVVVLGPQLRRPEEAFYRIERTSAVQRLLPFDGSQVHAWRFRCEPAECVPPPLDAYGEG